MQGVQLHNSLRSLLTLILMYKTAVYMPVNGVITHKNNKYQKSDIKQHDIA